MPENIEPITTHDDDIVVEDQSIVNSPESESPKEENKTGYKLRKLTDELAKTKSALDSITRREAEAQRAKRTETEQLRDELETLKSDLARERSQVVRERIANEFNLPSMFADRLVGSDEDSIRADAEQFAKLIAKPRVGSTTSPVRNTAAPSLDDQIAAAENAGDRGTALRLRRQQMLGN